MGAVLAKHLTSSQPASQRPFPGGAGRQGAEVHGEAQAAGQGDHHPAVDVGARTGWVALPGFRSWRSFVNMVVSNWTSSVQSFVNSNPTRSRKDTEVAGRLFVQQLFIARCIKLGSSASSAKQFLNTTGSVCTKIAMFSPNCPKTRTRVHSFFSEERKS